MLNRAYLFLGMLLASAGVWSQDALPTVPRVELERYAGHWYEVARLPNRFERDCAGDITAHYKLMPDQRVAVLNQCRKMDGSRMSARGVARSQDGSSSRLEVRFAPAWLSLLPFVWGDYWIIDLAPDHSWSLVGSPDRKYLWILSRAPALEADQFQRLVAQAKALGFATDTLVWVKNTTDLSRQP